MLSLLAESDPESRSHVNLNIRLDVPSSSPFELKAVATCQSDIVPDRIASETVYFKILPQELREAYDTIRSPSQRGASRRSATHLLDPIKDLGARLFNALFQAELGALYRESVSRGDEKDARLRICISATRGTLIEELPWEFLYDPLRNDFLALSSRRPIVRQVMADAPFEGAPVADALRIAFITTPDPGNYLNTVGDWEVLRQIADSEPARLHVERIPSASPNDLLKVVTSGSFDVVHFSGHATEQMPGAPLSPQALQLAGFGPGDTDVFPAEMLMRIPQRSLSPQLLCLNACNTHRLAQQLATRIPNVIGMRELVSTDFCVTFANGLYRSLVQGFSIEEAITAARALSDTVNPGGREWGSAVFCTSAPVPVQLANSAQRSARPAGTEDAGSFAPSDPTRAREWRKLKQQLELNQRNEAALSDMLEGLTRTETLGEAVRTISQGSVKDLRAQISRLSSTIADIQHRIRILGGG
ncbi:CHAT domain-containing protein [Boseaceae bacterium BT-24-1]|nr:CHAT domain-containing protein [Boseaceae bacterium BT-24-1]